MSPGNYPYWWIRHPYPVQMSQEKARRLLEILLDCQVILVYHSMDSRKGVDALISAMQNRAAPEKVHILIAAYKVMDHAILQIILNYVLSLMLGVFTCSRNS